MLLIGSSDKLHLSPVDFFDEPVHLIGVGGTSVLHALSYIQDRNRVSKVTIIDNNEDQIQLTLYFLQLAMDCDYRPDYMERAYGCTLKNNAKTWLDVPNISGLEAATGVRLLEDKEDHLRVESAWYSSRKYWNLWLENNDKRHVHIGWNSGYLQEGVFPLKENDTEGRVGQLSDYIPIDTEERTIVWLSNALAFSMGRGVSDPKLMSVVQQADKNPNIVFWGCASKKAQLLQVATKPYNKLWKRKTPHTYTNEAIQDLRSKGSMNYVLPFPKAEDRPKSGLPDCQYYGYDEYLSNAKTAPTTVLHILSWPGLDVLEQVVNVAKEHTTDRLLILEHNKYTLDRENLHNEGLSVEEVQEIMHRDVDSIRWCYGQKTGLRRNMILFFSMT